MKIKKSKNVFYVLTLLIINKIKPENVSESLSKCYDKNNSQNNIDTLPASLSKYIIHQTKELEKIGFIKKAENPISMDNHVIEVYDYDENMVRTLKKTYISKNFVSNQIEYTWKIVELNNFTGITYRIILNVKRITNGKNDKKNITNIRDNNFDSCNDIKLEHIYINETDLEDFLRYYYKLIRDFKQENKNRLTKKKENIIYIDGINLIKKIIKNADLLNIKDTSKKTYTYQIGKIPAKIDTTNSFDNVLKKQNSQKDLQESKKIQRLNKSLQSLSKLEQKIDKLRNPNKKHRTDRKQLY